MTLDKTDYYKMQNEFVLSNSDPYNIPNQIVTMYPGSVELTFWYSAESQAVIDRFYSLFKPPPGVFSDTREHARHGALAAESMGSFDFYSRWACLVYRYLRGTS